MAVQIHTIASAPRNSGRRHIASASRRSAAASAPMKPSIPRGGRPSIAVAAAGSPVFPPRSIVHVSRVKIAPGSVPSSTAATPASGRQSDANGRRKPQRGAMASQHLAVFDFVGADHVDHRVAGRRHIDAPRDDFGEIVDVRGAAADGRPPAGPAPAGSRASGKTAPTRRPCRRRAQDARSGSRSAASAGSGRLRTCSRSSAYRHARRRAPRSGSRAARRRGSTR